MKFGLDQKVEFKKSYALYRQILVMVITKVAKIFVYFAWHGQE